jgi:endonuclease-3
VFVDRGKAIRQLKTIEKLSDQRIRLAAEWRARWKVLISTILSSQTKDETTIEVSNRLYRKYSSLQKLANARLDDVRKIIKSVNYYKTKAKHVIETAKIIVGKYKGEIPKTREELIELPGVGRKVANVYLVEAYGAAAIGVDTHVAYLSQLLGWTKNKNPHKIEKDLERLFPKKDWNSINYILVRFGRMYGTRKRQRETLKEEEII